MTRALPDPRLVTYRGTRCIAGLSWSLAEPLAGRGWRARLGSALAAPPAAELRWADRVARIPERRALGLPALSQVVASGLSEENRAGSVLVLVTDPAQDLYTAFVLAGGKPVIGTERLLAGEAELKAAAGAILAAGGIETVLEPAGSPLLEGIGVARAELPSDAVETEGLPLATAGRAPARQALVLVSLLGASALFFDEGWAVIEPLLVAPPPPPPVVARVFLPEPESFVQGCLDAHAADWPTVPGWALEEAGCRIDAPGMDGLAWKSFRLDPQRNTIVSTRVAEMMYADWPHGLRIEPPALAAEIPFPLAWLDAAEAAATPGAGAVSAAEGPLRAAENAFVGIETSVATEPGAGGDLVTVTSPASLPEVLARIARMPGTVVERVERRGPETRLVLRAPALPPTTALGG